MKNSKRNLSARRVATFVAAFGALLMSSGMVLLATAPAANAANKVGICHATSSDTNPYVFISVDDDSAKLKGHLKHRSAPNKTWKSDGTYEGVAHQDGDPKRDFIGSFTDDQGVFHVYDGDITSASCDGDVEVPPAIADVEFTDPTCENQNTASYDPIGQNVTFSIEGTVGPGEHVTVTATADDGYTFDGEATTQDFEYTFAAAEECEVTPPVVTPPVVEPPTKTPTVVHAGLLGTSTTVSDLRTEQGIALLGAGLLLLVVAGGIAIPRGVRR